MKYPIYHAEEKLTNSNDTNFSRSTQFDRKPLFTSEQEDILVNLVLMIQQHSNKCGGSKGKIFNEFRLSQFYSIKMLNIVIL